MLKISWGTGVAVLYIGFVMLIGSLVWASMHQSFDLVSKDYYQEELAYQNVIEAGKNQSMLSAPISVNVAGEDVVLLFPDEFRSSVIIGNVHFYSKVNAAWDKQYPINSIDNSFTISKKELHNTVYQVKINWVAAGKSYYQETSLNLN